MIINLNVFRLPQMQSPIQSHHVCMTRLNSNAYRVVSCRAVWIGCILSPYWSVDARASDRDPIPDRFVDDKVPLVTPARLAEHSDRTVNRSAPVCAVAFDLALSTDTPRLGDGSRKGVDRPRSQLDSPWTQWSLVYRPRLAVGPVNSAVLLTRAVVAVTSC